MARTVLAEARHASGHADAARVEWDAARSAFEEFGAARWAERAEPRGDAPSPAPAVDAAGAVTRAAFVRDGGTRTVELAGSTVHVRDLKGFRYLERLLAEPGREFHVLDLVAAEHGPVPSSAVDDELVEVSEGTGAGLPTIDEEACQAHRRQLTEVEEDIEEATRLNDPGRVELAERDRDYLIAELTRAVGLGGRRRTVGGSAERARTSVTRTIRYSLERLAEHHPAAATHLERCVRTGTYCTYVPDPLAPFDWTL